MTGLVSFMHEGKSGFGRLEGEKVTDLTQIFADRFANLSAAANAGALDELFSAAGGDALDLAQVTLLAPLGAPGKIVCVGVNFPDRNAEYKDGQAAQLNPRFSSGSRLALSVMAMISSGRRNPSSWIMRARSRL